MMITDDNAKTVVKTFRDFTDIIIKSISQKEKLTLTQIQEKAGVDRTNALMMWIQKPETAEFNRLNIKFVEFSSLSNHTFDLNQLKFYVYTLFIDYFTNHPDLLKFQRVKDVIGDFKRRLPQSNVNKTSTTTPTTTPSTALSTPNITASELGSETDFFKKIQQMKGGNKKDTVNVSLIPTQPFSKYVSTPTRDDSTLRVDITTELTKQINNLSVAQKLVAYSFLKKLAES